MLRGSQGTWGGLMGGEGLELEESIGAGVVPVWGGLWLEGGR